eukprot:scaffold3723_cov112-Isochrysis_galbana.AAC.4
MIGNWKLRLHCKPRRHWRNWPGLCRCKQAVPGSAGGAIRPSGPITSPHPVMSDEEGALASAAARAVAADLSPATSASGHPGVQALELKCARFRDGELNPSPAKEEGLSCVWALIQPLVIMS